jgi:guanylate kinase
LDRIPSLHRHTKALAKTAYEDGVIESFTVVRHPPAGFGTEPYTVALIRLTSGKRTLAQLTTDGASPMIGATVSPQLRHIRTMENGLLVHDLKYRVVARKIEPLFTVTSYVLAVSGPSGVGKTTIARSLLSLFSSVAEQVPIITTRRAKKTDVEPYVHVSKKQFDAWKESGEIISSTHMPSKTEVRYYGYRRRDIEAVWKKGKLPIVVTEIHLLSGLVEALGRRAVLSCGLLPPGKSRRMMLSALLHRLRKRGRDTAEQIEERMKIAELDLRAFSDHAHLFDHLLVNDQLEACVETIRDIAVTGRSVDQIAS